MSVHLKSPKNLYRLSKEEPKQEHTSPFAKLLGDSGMLIGVVPIAIILAVTGHPEMALSLAGGILARFGANFIAEKNPN